MLLFAPISLMANQISNNTSFGFGINSGMYSAITIEGDTKWTPGLGFGFDVVAIRMLSNDFGLYSGLSFVKAKKTMKMIEQNGEFEVYLDWYQIQFPLLFATSFNGKNLSFELLYGFKLAQTVKLSLEEKNSGNSTDILYETSYMNFGISLGFNLKYRVANFNDIYIGITSDFYPNDVIKGDSRSSSYSYNARLNAGFLFRTHLFPNKK